MIAGAVAGARGLAIGAFVVAMGAAAYAGQNLHLLGPIGDGLVGMLLIGLAVGTVHLLLRVPAWLARRGLELLADRAPRSHRLLHAGPIPVLRLLERPLLGATLAIAVMLWLLPSDGPLAMFRSLAPFEILIGTGAVVGLLLAVSAWARRGSPPLRHARALAVATLVPAVVLSAGVGAWAVLPGAGDPIVHEDPAALAAIPLLDLADPSAPGEHAVVAVTYGSGVSSRRPEFGAEADWRTPTVDASAALPERDAIAAAMADFAWGSDSSRLPLNGLVWYPAEAEGPLPLALIVHGNHAALEFSDPGYAYLGAHLASHGIIAVSVDENYLNGDAFHDFAGQEMDVRAWLLLRHLDQFRTWNRDVGHPLAGRVDLDRVALVGHSRGGEAVALATAIEAGDAEVRGLPAAPRGFGIRAVVGIAPSDGMYAGPGAPVRLTDVDYLVLQGARDGDLPAYSGLRQYHRVKLTGQGDHLKVALYSQRANHGRFNAVWDVGDAGPVASWMLERGSLLAPEEQQRLAKAAIGAFLARSLLEETAYDAFFREPRSGRHWLPDDVVETHWEASGSVTIELEGRDATAAGVLATGFDTADGRDPMLRDRTTTGDRALLLAWSGDATLRVPLDAELAATIDADARLTISLAPSPDGGAVDPVIELRARDGVTAALRLSSVAAMRPSLPVRLWKLDILGDRYAPEEQLAWPVERFPQTYAIELSRFAEAVPGFDLTLLDRVTLRFEGSGSVYLDDLGFDPA